MDIVLSYLLMTLLIMQICHTALLHREQQCSHKQETGVQTRQLKDSHCIDNFRQTPKIFCTLTEKLLGLEFLATERACFGFASAILKHFY